jgi:hypothetical protein
MQFNLPKPHLNVINEIFLYATLIVTAKILGKKAFMKTKYKVTALHENKDCAEFSQEGMEGGIRKDPTRPVSMISLSARKAVDEAVLRGLCFKKFKADITLECDEMPETDTILVSGDLKLGILPERKRCWPDCILLEKDLPCPLIDGVRYAWVKSPGKLCLGDELKNIE